MGALFAYIFYPLYKYFITKVGKPTFSAFMVCFAILLILIIPAIFFVKTLVQQSYLLFILGKQKLATGLFTNCDNGFCNLLVDVAKNQEINYQIQQILKSITDWIIHRGSNILISIPNVLLNIFVMFFTMFYFLKDGRKFVFGLNHYLNIKGNNYLIISKRLKGIVQGIVYGYLIIALIQGALGAFGFFMFGIPSPLFWGLLMALLALIPFLGTGVIWVPASILLFLDGMFQNSTTGILKGIGLFIYGFIIISGTDNILRPKMVSTKAKIHPAIVLVGIFGGILVLGPIGVIVGPLLLSLTFVFFEVFVFNKYIVNDGEK